jgi:hypothetical protein
VALDRNGDLATVVEVVIRGDGTTAQRGNVRETARGETSTLYLIDDL